ncbi:MAG: hypothetical protein AAGM38_15855 [Pseudomonadota bacterium]
MSATVTQLRPAGRGDGGAQLKRPPIADSPVRPLGHVDGTYWFLSAAGERRSISAKDLESGRGVLDLFAGGLVHGDVPVGDWLAVFFPPRRTRAADKDPVGGPRWSKVDCGEWLMDEAQAVGLYDPAGELRSLGVWRAHDEKGGPVVLAHCGEALLRPDAPNERSGKLVEGAVYPRTHRGDFPAFRDLPTLDAIAAREADIRAQLGRLLEDVGALWNWTRPEGPRIWLGWIGGALLGAYPGWRAHLWVHGRRGSGKSTLAEVTSLLLGPLSQGVLTDATTAGVRQSGDRQARPYLFDEAEPDSGGELIARMVELFRTMSGAGAQAWRGSADHSARKFLLHGAGAMFSILPARLQPQDASRFCKLSLGKLSFDDPVAAAARLACLKRRAAALGRELWLHALTRAHAYDAHADAFAALVQRMGGEPRDGATIGAVLAGHDLLLSPEAEPDEDRLADARDVAAPLVEVAMEAAEEGEGERCWARLTQSSVHFGGGDSHYLAELIYKALKGADEASTANKKLGRLGMRVRKRGAKGSRGFDELLIVPSDHPSLDNLLKGTRWVAGGHRDALLTMDGVVVVAPTSIGGKTHRALSIPSKHLPEFNQDDAE